MQYKNEIETATRVAGIRLWKRAPYLLACVALPMAIFAAVNRGIPELGLILLYSSLIVLAALAGGVFLGLRGAKKQISTYNLTIEADTITRTQSGLAPASIAISDISRVDRNKHKTLLVYGVGGKLVFGIPHTLERHSEVEALLEDKVGISKSKASKAKRFGNIVSYLGILLIPAFMFIPRANVVFPLGIVLAGYLGLLGVSVLRNKQTSKLLKAVMGVGFLLMFAAMIVPRTIEAGRVLFH